MPIGGPGGPMGARAGQWGPGRACGGQGGVERGPMGARAYGAGEGLQVGALVGSLQKVIAVTRCKRS